MSSLHSVVVAFDGESKCGKTTVIENVAGEAQYVLCDGWYDAIDNLAGSKGPWSDEIKQELRDVVSMGVFSNIVTISAGNAFRAAAYYVLSEEEQGITRDKFTPNDADALRHLLRSNGVIDTLQTDAAVGERVSKVAQMTGVQALCGAIFCDAIRDAYFKDDGANLVIVDGRNPVETMQRNNLVGSGAKQIRPDSILPVYIKTPTEVAAARMGGLFCKKLSEVSRRRTLDATREELPVVMPPDMVRKVGEWLRQLNDHPDGVIRPYLLDNHAEIDLEDIKYIAGVLAVASQDVGLTRK